MFVYGGLQESSQLFIFTYRRGFSQAEQDKLPTYSKESSKGVANVLNNSKPKKTKRGGRKRKHKSENLTIFSTNAAGLNSKSDSLKNEIKTIKAAVFTIQETHFKKKGNYKLQL